MPKIFSEEKPDLDSLTHYGVKGMKWGVRRDPSTGARPIAKTLNDSKFGKLSEANADRYNRKQARKVAGRPSTAAIQGARNRVSAEKKSIKRAEERANRISDKDKRKEALAEVGKKRMEFLNNPDRVTSARMTNGETVALALFVTTPVGAVAARTATNLRSRVIESRQASGAYG